MAKSTWTISGRMMVEEKEVSGVLTSRPLAGVEVEVSASNFGVYDSWGTVRTNSDGYFTLRNEKDGSKRKIKVKVRFSDSELEVNAGLLANPGDFLSPALEVFEHSHEVEGPSINIGTRTFKTGAGGELGVLDHIRRAIAWYACKTLITTLKAKDSYFAFKGKIKVIYPAKVVSGIPYANGVTRCAYIQSGWWDIQMVLHEVMHLWNYDHNYGTANWFGAVFCPVDLNTHGQAERRPIATHEGF
ncbi:MAG: carboxypeptidase-like regulatory domain-containing protein, partial [Chloroflexota bacterium]|nr:carboxypeptidase-like regulatory domain-containing protein [Chloroflexota bacterium]